MGCMFSSAPPMQYSYGGPRTRDHYYRARAPSIPVTPTRRTSITRKVSPIETITVRHSRPSRHSTTAYVTAAELERHDGRNDLAPWIAVDGHVYDISMFMHRHPGGQYAVLKVAGTDATHTFRTAHSHVDIRSVLKVKHVSLGVFCCLVSCPLRRTTILASTCHRHIHFAICGV